METNQQTSTGWFELIKARPIFTCLLFNNHIESFD